MPYFLMISLKVLQVCICVCVFGMCFLVLGDTGIAGIVSRTCVGLQLYVSGVAPHVGRWGSGVSHNLSAHLQQQILCFCVVTLHNELEFDVGAVQRWRVQTDVHLQGRTRHFTRLQVSHSLHGLVKHCSLLHRT